MIDYKATIKNIHTALSDLNIDELLIILDCIKEIPSYNNSVHINSGGYTYPSMDNVLLTSKLKSPSVSDALYSLQLEDLRIILFHSQSNLEFLVFLVYLISGTGWSY